MLNNITATSIRTPIALSSQASTPASGSAVRVRGRRGRPPGAKNQNPRPDKGSAKKPKATPIQHQKTLPKDRATPDTQDNQAAPVRTPSSSLQNPPRISTTPARASGLRNAMSPLNGIAVVIPSRSPSVMEGSPAISVRLPANKVLPKSMPKTNIKQPPAPSYRVYKCCWDTCPAELHNLETLKKHVRKHRSKEDLEKEPVQCKWANCGDSEHGGLLLKSVEAWDEHVTGKHVNAAARDSMHSSGTMFGQSRARVLISQ